MFKRTLAKTLQRAARGFPVLLLTGPRQSGKTTLLREIFPQHQYVTLESPDTLLRLQKDPRGFLEHIQKPIIVDEAQHFPALFSYLQEYIDQKKIKLPVILSGSQNFRLLEAISQTLAGRAAVLELLPLSFSEYLTDPAAKPPTVFDFLYHGGYPRPYKDKLELSLWANSYIQTYVERDVRSLVNLKDLLKFQLFLRLCAGRHGQLLNLSGIANDCGVSQPTVLHWLGILEASYLVFRLPPYHQNYNKRLVKTSKLYFYDPSIVCHLLGIESAEHLMLHASRGAIMEGFVVTEVVKHFLHQGKRPRIYFWRDHIGLEVDLLIEQAGVLKAIEVKSSNTLSSDAFRSLLQWQKIAHPEKPSCCVVYTGEKAFQFENIQALPWDQIESWVG